MQFSTPQIVRDTDQLRRILRGWRGAGSSIALAPVMGGIHAGSLSLIETAKKQAARVVVSVSTDLDMAKATLLGRAACDLVFAPQLAPNAAKVSISANGLGSQDDLDRRITEFARLLNQVQPDNAVIGERDWQQLVAIRQMVRDLNFPVGIVSSSTIRESDGLAVACRNSDLTTQQRAVAPTLFKVLTASAGLIANGESVSQVLAASEKFLKTSGFDHVEYVTSRRAHDLEPVSAFTSSKPTRLLAAVQLGRVRLTDNVPIARTTS